MQFPLHQFEIETDSDKSLAGLVMREIHSLPAIVKLEFSDADRFAFRLILEEYVVGLLKEMQASALRSRHWTTPCYRLVVLFERGQITINFNGQEKVISYPKSGPIRS